MKAYKYINTFFLIVVIISTFIFSFIHRNNHIKNIPGNSSYIDTTYVIDTIYYKVPVPIDSVVVRYKTVLVPFLDTFAVHKDTLSNDSISRNITAVNLPITQKRYNTKDYNLWISGYDPCLDSIKVFHPNKTIVRHIIPKEKRWTIGLQTGIQISNQKFAPYIGIGVGYTLFSW